MLWDIVVIDIRGDCGGIISYSIKGLVVEIGRICEIVLVVLNKFLDVGFI